MDTMKGKITLSEYAHLACTHNLMDNMSTVIISKKPYGSDDFKSAKLSVDEFNELSKHLAEIKTVAQQMNEHANNSGFGDGVLPQNLTKILSQTHMAVVNLFTAPNKTSYVTLAIRPYVIDKDASYKMTKDGVTLNYRELQALADARFQVHHLIQEMMSSTRVVAVATPDDVERERIHIMSFLSLAQPGQKMRLIIEKKTPPEMPHMPPPPPPPSSGYGNPASQLAGATLSPYGAASAEAKLKSEGAVVAPSSYSHVGGAVNMEKK